VESLEFVRVQACTFADTYNLGRLFESHDGDSAVVPRQNSIRQKIESKHRYLDG
jgi:hypothetical protein